MNRLRLFEKIAVFIVSVVIAYIFVSLVFEFFAWVLNK